MIGKQHVDTDAIDEGHMTERMITPMHQRALDRLRQFKAACEPRPPTTVVVSIDGTPNSFKVINGQRVIEKTPRGTVTSS
jgi:hypothetical protein